MSNTAYENWVQSGLHIWGDHLLQAFNKALEASAPEHSGPPTLEASGQIEIVKRKRTVSRICIVKKQSEQAKREYSFNFVFNFSKNACIVGEKPCKIFRPPETGKTHREPRVACWPAAQKLVESGELKRWEEQS